MATDVGALFEFTAASASIVDLPECANSALLGEDFETALAGDGGVPGVACAALVEETMDLANASLLRFAASSLDSLASDQQRLGLRWGAAFLAYDDCDKRTFPFDLADGGTAVFVENIDLMSAWSSFVLGMRSAGEIEVWMIERYDASIPETIGAFASGLEAPPHVTAHSLELGTGLLTKADRFDRTGVLSTVGYGLDRAIEVVGELDAGTLELDGFNRIRRDFEVFEPDYGAFDEADDEEEPQAEAPRP